MERADRVDTGVWRCAARSLGVPLPVLRRLPRPLLFRWLRWRLRRAEAALDRANLRVDRLLVALEDAK